MIKTSATGMRQVLQHLILLLCLTATKLPAQQPSQGALDSAITRCLAYFHAMGDSTPPDAYLILSFLHRRFATPHPQPAKEAFIAHYSGPQSPHPEFRAFMRLIQDTPFEPEFLQPKGLIDDITLAAVWFDHHGESRTLKKHIRKADHSDPYVITHSFLSVLIARGQFSARRLNGLSRLLSRQVQAIAASSGPQFTDIQMEAIAILAFADSPTADFDERVSQVIAAQGADGGWPHNPGVSPSSHPHTSCLALWALLECRFPDANAPFVARSSD